jgi:hypothetical protein
MACCNLASQSRHTQIETNKILNGFFLERYVDLDVVADHEGDELLVVDLPVLVSVDLWKDLEE